MALEASEIAVRVRLLGGSAFQTEAQKVANSTEEIGAAAKKTDAVVGSSFTSVGGKLDSVGSKMMSFGRTLSVAGVGIVAFGAYASKTASTFQQDMTLLSTNANESAKNIGWMSNAVLDLGKQFGQTPDAMAKGLYAFESVGYHGKQALNDIKAAAIGSAVGLDDLANTTDAVSSVMKSKIAGAGGPVEAMSMMDRAIGLGKMHLADLTEAMKSGIIPLAQTFHLDFPSILANISALTGVGTPAGQVAARMRLMLTSMENLTPGATKAWASIGMNDPARFANDLAKPGHLITALQDMKMLLSNLSSPNQNAILAATFGRSRGMGQIAGSLSQLDTISADYATLMGTTPATLMQHFDQTKNTTAFKEKQIRAQFDADMVKLGNTINLRILPVLIRLLGPLQSVIDGFGHLPKPLQDVMLGLAGAVIVGGPLFMFTGALVKGAGLFIKGIDAITGMEGLGLFGLGLKTTAGELALLAAPIAAVLGVYEMWHNKGIRHGIEHAGKSVGTAVGDYLAKDLVSLGFSHADDYYKTQRYLNSKQFKSYNPLIRSDIEGLLNPNSYDATRGVTTVAHDLQAAGVNVNNIPGLTEKIRQAVEDGVKQASIFVTLPNGRVLAQTVNEANRRNQNRR